MMMSTRWKHPKISRTDLRPAVIGVLLPGLMLVCYYIDDAARAFALGCVCAVLGFVQGASWALHHARDRIVVKVNETMNDVCSSMLAQMLNDGVVVPGPNFPEVGGGDVGVVVFEVPPTTRH